MENMFSVFPWSCGSNGESLRELPNFHSCFCGSMETRYMLSFSWVSSEFRICFTDYCFSVAHRSTATYFLSYYFAFFSSSLIFSLTDEDLTTFEYQITLEVHKLRPSLLSSRAVHSLSIPGGWRVRTGRIHDKTANNVWSSPPLPALMPIFFSNPLLISYFFLHFSHDSPSFLASLPPGIHNESSLITGFYSRWAQSP